MEFDHELRLWLKSKKSRKTHLDTRMEGVAAQSSRKIARSVDVINTGQSAGTSLTGCTVMVEIICDTKNKYFFRDCKLLWSKFQDRE